MSKRSMSKRIIASSLAISMMMSAFAPSAFADVPTLATADQAPSIINTSDSPDAAPATNTANPNTDTIIAPTPTPVASPAEASPSVASPAEASPSVASPTEDLGFVHRPEIGEEHDPAPRALTPRVSIPNSVIPKFPSDSLAVVNDIDPSNLNDWFVLDTTNTTDEVAWNSTVNANKLHPYWYFKENQMYDTTMYTNLTYDANAPGSGNTSFLHGYFNSQFYGGSSSVKTNRDANQHVIPTGTKNNATLVFTGNGSLGYVNMALANVTSPKLKSTTFDIYPENVIPHAMYSYGIALNARVENNATTGKTTFYGYYLMFHFNGLNFTTPPADMSIYLVDATDGYQINTGDKLAGDDFYKKLMGDASRITNLGTFNNRNFRLNLDIENDKVKINITYLNPDGTLQATPIVNTVQPVNNHFAEGNTAFGPMAIFKGSGHTCERSSVVQFNKLQLEIGYSLNFFRNDDSINQEYISFKGFEPGESLNSKSAASPTEYFMPASPTRAGYIFDGWYMEPSTVTPFDPSVGLTAITNVYAKWVPITAPTITINSDNTNWTNKDVTLTYDVRSSSAIGTVTSTKDADPTAVHNAGNALSFTSPAGIVYGANGVLNVTADGSYIDDVNPAGAYHTVADFVVNNIDKTAPLLDITGIPIGIKLDDLTQVAANTKYSDIGDVNKTPSIPSVQTNNPADSISGVDLTQSIFVLFDKKGNQVASVPVDQINTINTSTLKGAYFFDIVIVDKAGNMVDSYGNKYDPNNIDPNGKKPGDIPKDNYDKKPNDPDHKVVVNAGDPVFTIVAPTPAAHANGYFNSNVDLEVKYEVTSDVPVLDLEVTGDDGVSIKLANPTPVPGTNYTYAGTFSSKQTHGVSSTVTYKGSATDDAGGVANDTKTVKFDGVAPDIQFTDKDLTKGQITVSDSESGINQTVVVITKKATGKQETLTITSTGSDTDTLIKNKLEDMGSGIYDINVTSTDNVTNQSQKSSEVYYEADKDIPKDPGTGKPKPKDDETLKIEFTQNPDNSIYTNKDVAVTYTITSTVRLKTIAIDGGAAQDVSSVAPNASGKYIYTGPVNVDHNYDVTVTYVTYSRGKQLEAKHDVLNIDKQEPGFGVNKFQSDHSLLAAKGSTVEDKVDPARSANAISGIQSVKLVAVPSFGSGAAITSTSAATTSGSNSASIDDAIDDLISKKGLMASMYDVTVTITDNAGNTTKSTYTRMDLSGNVENPPTGGETTSWNVEVVKDNLPYYLQFTITNKGNPTIKPTSISVIQTSGSGPYGPTPLTLQSGSALPYRTAVINAQPNISSVTLSINNETVTIQIPPSTTPPVTATNDVIMPFTSGTTYTWADFNTKYNNLQTNNGSLITKKVIKQYTTTAAAQADTTGTGGVEKMATGVKNPPAIAKNVRIVVTYTNSGSTYTQVSDPFIIQR